MLTFVGTRVLPDRIVQVIVSLLRFALQKKCVIIVAYEK